MNEFNPAMYEFTVINDDFSRSRYNVVAYGREEAMHKFLDKHPDLYNFRITNWWQIDIL
jgi:hypothetical protein